jgi:hypothetical protein
MAREARISMLVSGSVPTCVLCPCSYHHFWSIAHPLAKGFALSDGKVDVVVPNVESKNSYIVARACPFTLPSFAAVLTGLTVLGDSGNISPEFTITDEN